MQKKNIDELFRDKLSDFKQNPDNKVWRAIDASLEKKKKKRGIPLWWSASGIAAALLIGFLIFNPFTADQPTDEILVDTNNDSKKNNDQQPNTENRIFIDSLDNNENTIVEQSTVYDTRTDSANTNVKEETNLWSKKQPSNTVAGLSSKNNKSKKTQNNLAISKSEEVETTTSISTNKALLAENNTTEEQKFEKITNDSSNNNQYKNKTVDANTENEPKALDQKNLTTESAVVQNANTKENLEDAESSKKSIFEEIEDQAELKKAKVAGNRWSAGPNVAPVYFNALGEGSPVNSIFTPNSKSGNVNMSYGLSVAYAVTKKLTIRSGINKVDYGYDTEDVTFSSSSSLTSRNSQLSNIDYAETSNTLIISSNPPSNIVDAITTDNNSNSVVDVSAKSPSRDGIMSQQFGYLELPVELNYSLVDKKLGINLIGGVSSLFLVDNSVSLTSGELTTEIGEANNINELNFSANMGLGLDYNFSQKVRFNVEPIFKYQLNTFSNVNGNFRPYSIGVYSGLTFKF